MRWTICRFDPGTAPIASLWQFSALNHSTISSTPEKGVQLPRAFICFNYHWMNLMYKILKHETSVVM